MGGKILKVDNWGKRRLAYEVAKERKGIYLYWLYLAQPGVVEETERNLRMLDSVIRYLTVQGRYQNIDIAARPSEIDDAAYEKRRHHRRRRRGHVPVARSEDLPRRGGTITRRRLRRRRHLKPPRRPRLPAAPAVEEKE
jgi:ribosomal protein S6